MTWVKLDDNFPSHPKTLAAGEQAAWLYVAGLCWSKSHLTDGTIPLVALPTLVRCGAHKARMLAERLVLVGLWERTAHGFIIHDYAERNMTRQEVEDKRESNRARITSWREKRNGCNASVTALHPSDGTKVKRRHRDRVQSTEIETEVEIREEQKSSTLGSANPAVPPSELVLYVQATWPDVRDVPEPAWREAFPAVDLLGEAKRAYAWEQTQPAEKRKRAHVRFLGRWYARCQERAATGGPARSPPLVFGAQAPNYHAPARLRTKAELDALARESLALAARDDDDG